MSQIRAASISNVAGTGPVTLTKQSAAKMWAGVEINGTTTGSFNVSSVTDSGNGLAAVGLSSAFSSTSYAIGAVTEVATVTANAFGAARSSASQFVLANYVSGLSADPVRYFVAAHGDLA